MGPQRAGAHKRNGDYKRKTCNDLRKSTNDRSKYRCWIGILMKFSRNRIHSLRSDKQLNANGNCQLSYETGNGGAHAQFKTKTKTQLANGSLINRFGIPISICPFFLSEPLESETDDCRAELGFKLVLGSGLGQRSASFALLWIFSSGIFLGCFCHFSFVFRPRSALR